MFPHFTRNTHISSLPFPYTNISNHIPNHFLTSIPNLITSTNKIMYHFFISPLIPPLVFIMKYYWLCLVQVSFQNLLIPLSELRNTSYPCDPPKYSIIMASFTHITCLLLSLPFITLPGYLPCPYIRDIIYPW